MKRIDELNMVTFGLPARPARVAAVGLICALSLAGCSKDGDSGQPKKGADASSICDGAFDTQAARSLESVSGARRFDEIKQPADMVTFARLLKELGASADNSDAQVGKYLCQFSAVGGKLHSPVDVSFDWTSTDQSPSPATTSSRKATAYTFARYTKATDNYAWITIRCTPKQDDTVSVKTSYLTATVTTYPPDTSDPAKSKTFREDNIRLAYSAAAKAARTAGCFKESELPEMLGELRARPTAAK
ncbi:hypothetical protein [Streptomyces sp. NPDC001450]